MAENTRRMFKCCRCGVMVERREKDRVKCPSCGHDCCEPHCRAVDASDEGY